MNDQII